MLVHTLLYAGVLLLAQVAAKTEARDKYFPSYFGALDHNRLFHPHWKPKPSSVSAISTGTPSSATSAPEITTGSSGVVITNWNSSASSNAVASNSATASSVAVNGTVSNSTATSFSGAANVTAFIPLPRTSSVPASSIVSNVITIISSFVASPSSTAASDPPTTLSLVVASSTVSNTVTTISSVVASTSRAAASDPTTTISSVVASTTSSIPAATVSVATNGTANTTSLRTWWHNTGEFNSKTAVGSKNVRQSSLYSVQVSSLGDDTYYNSFVYETIPRNGQDQSLTTYVSDGVTIEPTINMTMGWSQFLCQGDVSVKVHRLDGFNATASDITIRPTTISYGISDSDGDILITVPCTGKPVQFSVEYSDIMYDFRNGNSGLHSGFVQDLDPEGYAYSKDLTDEENPKMGTEPLHSLLIFASPFETSEMIPDINDPTSVVVEPGVVTGLEETTANTLIFKPGVYDFTSTAHANLSETVNWVYIEGGAYIKGAIQFWTHAPIIKATGHGVLSGEQYPYQANPTVGYINDASNENSLRMWKGYSHYSIDQTFLIDGPTINAPPFNSVDFLGDLEHISIHANDYKQVGAFYGQTDGMTLYSNAQIRNIFYHSNDDTIKTYGSNISVSDIIVWKGTTAPTIQLGWASRNISNVTITNIDIIHSRYPTNGSHPSLIGSNQIYPLSESLSNTADLTNTISEYSISNIRSEGISGNLMRICPLSNYKNFSITNASIESFPPETDGIFGSQLPAFTDGDGNVVGMEGFVIEGYSVNGTRVSMGEGNYGYTEIGGLNIAEEFLKSGGVSIL